jgi:pimeloyl-ACP methyl ester carboxylesterase
LQGDRDAIWFLAVNEKRNPDPDSWRRTRRQPDCAGSRDSAGAVCAIVSRGGRPDLAGEALPRVLAPTLLIVGGRDEVVIELNEQARGQMRGKVQMEIVPGATHLFEEAGALEQVAQLAAAWFERHSLAGQLAAGPSVSAQPEWR